MVKSGFHTPRPSSSLFFFLSIYLIHLTNRQKSSHTIQLLGSAGLTWQMVMGWGFHRAPRRRVQLGLDQVYCQDSEGPIQFQEDAGRKQKSAMGLWVSTLGLDKWEALSLFWDGTTGFALGNLGDPSDISGLEPARNFFFSLKAKCRKLSFLFFFFFLSYLLFFSLDFF